MEIERIRALRGPNLWGRCTSIEAIVHCTASEREIERRPGFEERLRARFPQVGALRPIGAHEPVSMARALQVSALQLQAEAGCPVTFGRTAATVDEGTFQIVFEYS